MRDRLSELKGLNLKLSYSVRRADVAVNLIRDEVPGKDGAIVDLRKYVDALGSHLDSLEQEVSKMGEIQGKVISSSSNDSQLKDTLDHQTTVIKKMAAEFKVSLRELSSMGQDSTLDSNAVRRMRQTHCELLQTRFVDIMNGYQVDQLKFREDHKDKIRRQFEIMGKQVADDQLEDMLESGDVAVFTRGIVMDSEKLAMVRARYDDIMKLEKSIRELKDLMEDLAQYVSLQGDKIDNIEAHISRAVEHVEKGIVVLNQGLKYKRASQKKKLIFYAIVAIVVVVVIAVIFTSF
ncbi:Syntaxin [Halotydeus destructor]|nr:Syntaxin [Halotydeus destructor]